MDAGKALVKAGETVLASVDTAVERRWDDAVRRAESTTAVGTAARVAEVTDSIARELAAIGAASGGVAAVPGVGTLASATAAASEFGWVTLRLADLILTIASIHGHEEADVEERRAWVLSILAFGDRATRGFTKVAGDVGQGVGAKAVARIPVSKLQLVNRILGRTVLTKYGSKRGAVALGRVLPFGIGAAVGGAANYATVHAIARQADRFFRTPVGPDAVDAVAHEVPSPPPSLDV